MNTKRLDANSRQSAIGKNPWSCISSVTSQVPHRRKHPPRCNRFRHLALHPNRLTQATWVVLKLANKLLHGWDLKVYLFLLDKADKDTGRCWYWQKTIAKELQCSIPSVKRAVAELCRLQLLAIDKTRTGNLMTLLNPPEHQGSPMIPAKKGAHGFTRTYVLVNPGRGSNAPLPRAREGAAEPKPGSPDEPPQAATPAIPAEAPRKPANQPRRRWQGRHSSVLRQLTPVQKAAERVMLALGEPLSRWRTREAIAQAIRLWSGQNPSRELDEACAALVEIQRDFDRARRADLLWRKHPVCALTFFSELWNKRDSWGWDLKAQQLAQEARVGTAGTTGATGTTWEEERDANPALFAHWAEKERREKANG